MYKNVNAFSAFPATGSLGTPNKNERGRVSKANIGDFVIAESDCMP